jgi:hypothetical protein
MSGTQEGQHTMELKAGAIAINHLCNGQTVTVRVIEYHTGLDGWRVTDAREIATNKQLIQRNKTWLAPASRLTVVG